MMVTLWESRPIIKKEKADGDDIEVDRVQIDPDFKLPLIETINRGVSYILKIFKLYFVGSKSKLQYMVEKISPTTCLSNFKQKSPKYFCRAS
jgi:hypothetical protein